MADENKTPLPEAENAVDEAANEAIEVSEELTETPVVEAFDHTVTAVQDTIETLEPENDTIAAVAVHTGAHDAHAEMLSDTTTVLGRKVTLPGGIYTAVFGFLAVATLAEIIIAEMPSGGLGIALLLAIATIKSILVVMYYMHLKTDSRIFTVILLGPTLMVVIALVYLVAVPLSH